MFYKMFKDKTLNFSKIKINNSDVLFIKEECPEV